ncbi:hypothetical protein C2E25_15800 [Geothermobacter hydrogeniphilus]|uniref:Metal-binding motif-containing protein n=1 Tax=Geothermobacter hydrogeniphilus TaxID=1969733 RepID=A0A2K2H647_9BACT|nr:hypothetical protein [Geothermobacter hydrogeniphilus]PNU18795.1 hypothetical protein C2E25_15800 [Geothermobacter hydrogeniphilus]
MCRGFVIVLLLACLLPVCGTAFAASNMISYQGVLTDSGGASVNGVVTLEAAIFDAASGGNRLWGETHTAVTVTNGSYHIQLGSGVPLSGSPPLDTNLFAQSERWLQISVNGEVLLPRQPLSGTPFALRAAGVCVSGDYVTCYEGDPATLNVGPCKPGLRQCNPAGNGFDSLCEGMVLPDIEVCDGLDNDCNGLVDDGAAGQQCDDGDPCTTDSCSGGGCSHLPACDDGNPLTDDSCNPVDGQCSHTPVPDGTFCDDGDPCTIDGIVSSGVCVSQLKSCDDANACTTDSCNPATGLCEHADNPGYTEACYTGPAATRNVGDCTDGTQACSGGSFNGCIGEVTPTTEICGGGDEDCDGLVDEQDALNCINYYLDADGDGYGSWQQKCYCAPGIAHQGAIADQYTATQGGTAMTPTPPSTPAPWRSALPPSTITATRL